MCCECGGVGVCVWRNGLDVWEGEEWLGILVQTEERPLLIVGGAMFWNALLSTCNKCSYAWWSSITVGRTYCACVLRV